MPLDAAATAAYLDAPVRWIDTPAARLPLRRFGQGADLLLVHGFPLSGFTWRKLLPALSAHFTCHVLDLPGLGASQWNDRTDFSFPGQGRTLAAVVDALGLARLHVMAQDTGGTFARYLALQMPGRISRLVLINTEMPGHRPPWIPLYQRLLKAPATLTVLRGLLASRVFRRSAMGFGGCFADPSLIEGDFHRHVVEPLLRDPMRMEGLRRYLLGAQWGPVDALAHEHAKLSMPVLLLWGADDPTFPLPLARAMATQFPDARVTPIAGARLLVHEEKPEEVAREVTRFLQAS
jgi:haloalkane dehalogenase